MKKRISYYLWRYPIVSETFIQREISALKKSGLDILVIADSVDEFERENPNLRHLVHGTTYLLPVNLIKLFRFIVLNLIYNSIKCLSLLVFVIRENYDFKKSLKQDIKIFIKAIYLGGILNENGVRHIHSPWADVNCFIALAASKITGLPFSLQARAHDIHRINSVFALSEKFGNSKFIVTNTGYNEEFIKEILEPSQWYKIRLIYNGINLDDFNPGQREFDYNKQINLLCVARLIPQKGLTYLLDACDIIRNKGYDFKCRIIGGTEEPRYTDYYLGILDKLNDLSLRDYVELDGVKPFEYVLQQYQDADIFVLPCIIAEDGSRDIIPNVLIEAMAMKLPVISTTVTGVPEIVDHGINGILVSPGSEDTLADEIINLIENPDMRIDLGNQARIKVETRFNIKKNIESYIELFEN